MKRITLLPDLLNEMGCSIRLWNALQRLGDDDFMVPVSEFQKKWPPWRLLQREGPRGFGKKCLKDLSELLAKFHNENETHNPW